MRLFLLMCLTLGCLADTWTQAPLNPAQLQQVLEQGRYREVVQAGEGLFQSFAADRAWAEAIATGIITGNAYLEQGDFEQAREQYVKALGYTPFLPSPGADSLAAQCHNNLGEVHFRQADYQRAVHYHQEALARRRALFGDRHVDVADSYNNLGNCHFATGQYSQAVEFHRLALSIRRSLLPPDDPDIAVSCMNLGNCALQQQQIELALGLFQQAYGIRRKKFGEQHPATARALLALGKCRLARFDYGPALSAIEGALAVYQKHFDPRHIQIATAYEYLADAYMELGRAREARPLYQLAYQIQVEWMGGAHYTQAVVLDKTGLCYQAMDDYATARQYHQAAVELARPVAGTDVGSFYNNWGNSYFKAEEWSTAKFIYQEALKLNIENAALKATLLNNTGLCWLREGEPAVAGAFFERALALTTTSERISYLINLAKAQARQGDRQARLHFQQAVDETSYQPGQPFQGSRSLLIHALQAQAEYLARLQDPEWHQINQNLDTALQYAGALQQDQYASTGAMMLSGLYRSAIQLNIQWWQQTRDTTAFRRAFECSERAKSFALVQAVQASHAVQFASIPPEVLEKERMLKLQIHQLEKLVDQREGSIDTLNGLRIEQRHFLSELRQQYPEYYQLRYSTTPRSLQELQHHLQGTGQVLISYTLGKEAYYAFLITRDEMQLIPLDSLGSSRLERLIITLRSKLTAYPQSFGQEAARLAQEYVESAHQLYELLIQPLEAFLPVDSRAVIFPDGPLHFLPFELLIGKKPEAAGRFKSHDYLLHRLAINYAPSATLWYELSNRPYRKAGKGLLAIAPDFAGNQFGLAPLRYNHFEASSASEMYRGDLLAGPAATLDNFLARAPHHDIILLATHGEANPSSGEYSWLAFTELADTLDNELLYARDLYNQQWQADLIILSACESGVGQLSRTEGLLSMNRGFFFTGARSVVSTLWSVDDARSPELTLGFLRYLRKGWTKDEALRQSKLDYLDAHTHDQAHPFYWAAAVAMGSTQPVGTSGRGWWIAASMIAGLLLLFLWRRNPVVRKISGD